MKRKYITKQEDIKDCGAASISSIIKYYDGYVPLETLRLYTNTSYEGTNAYNLINCANKLGFYAYGEKVKEIHENNHQVYMLVVFSVPLHLFSIIEGLAGLYSGKNKKHQKGRRNFLQGFR